MYSINVAVPGQVRQLANKLYPELTSFASIRSDHSVLVKRLGKPDVYPHLAQQTREALAGTTPITVTVTGIDYFADPPRGPSPVVYLTLDSPGLDNLHRDLVEEMGAMPELEGQNYTMHITLARDGSIEDAQRLAEKQVEEITWTVNELLLWNAKEAKAAERISLPVG